MKYAAHVILGGTILMLLAGMPAGAETRILLFGDSISAMHAGVYRLENVLEQQLTLHDPGETSTIVNASQGGEWIGPGIPQAGVAVPLFDTISTGKYFDVVAANPVADYAFIQYAANDGKVYSPADFKSRMAALCDLLETDYPGIDIILATSMYLDYTGPYWIAPSWVATYTPGTSTRNDYLAPYYGATRALATERGYSLADVTAAVQAEVAGDNADLYVGVGDIHPNDNGTAVIADTYFRTLTSQPGDPGNVDDTTNGCSVAHGHAWLVSLILCAACPFVVLRAGLRTSIGKETIR